MERRGSAQRAGLMPGTLDRESGLGTVWRAHTERKGSLCVVEFTPKMVTLVIIHVCIHVA